MKKKDHTTGAIQEFSMRVCFFFVWFLFLHTLFQSKICFSVSLLQHAYLLYMMPWRIVPIWTIPDGPSPYVSSRIPLDDLSHVRYVPDWCVPIPNSMDTHMVDGCFIMMHTRPLAMPSLSTFLAVSPGYIYSFQGKDGNGTSTYGNTASKSQTI